MQELTVFTRGRLNQQRYLIVLLYYFNQLLKESNINFLLERKGTYIRTLVFYSNIFVRMNVWILAKQAKNTLRLVIVRWLRAADRSSPPEMFFEKSFLKIHRKFTEELPCQSVILLKLLYWCQHFFAKIENWKNWNQMLRCYGAPNASKVVSLEFGTPF